MRSTTTLVERRTVCGSASRSSSGVMMPICARRTASRPATPHRSVSSSRASACSWASRVSSMQTPPEAGSRLAVRLATLASVLVGPIPTDTGMPVHCSTVARSRRACSSRRPSKPPRPKKASSIEYTSSSGVKSDSTRITRADRSP